MWTQGITQKRECSKSSAEIGGSCRSVPRIPALHAVPPTVPGRHLSQIPSGPLPRTCILTLLPSSFVHGRVPLPDRIEERGPAPLVYPSGTVGAMKPRVERIRFFGIQRFRQSSRNPKGTLRGRGAVSMSTGISTRRPTHVRHCRFLRLGVTYQ